MLHIMCLVCLNSETAKTHHLSSPNIPPPTASRANLTLLDSFERPPQTRNSFASRKKSLQSTLDNPKISVNTKATRISWKILQCVLSLGNEKERRAVTKGRQAAATWCLGVCQESVHRCRLG